MTQLSLFDADVLAAKLDDAASTPRLDVSLDPAEAEALGAFDEQALSDQDAQQSTLDLFARVL